MGNCNKRQLLCGIWYLFFLWFFFFFVHLFDERIKIQSWKWIICLLSAIRAAYLRIKKRKAVDCFFDGFKEKKNNQIKSHNTKEKWKQYYEQNRFVVERAHLFSPFFTASFHIRSFFFCLFYFSGRNPCVCMRMTGDKISVNFNQQFFFYIFFYIRLLISK